MREIENCSIARTFETNTLVMKKLQRRKTPNCKHRQNN
jgi:hypothetical protein